MEKEIAVDSWIEEIKLEILGWVIPKRAIVIPSLLHEYHDSPMGGNLRDVKTYL